VIVFGQRMFRSKQVRLCVVSFALGALFSFFATPWFRFLPTAHRLDGASLFNDGTAISACGKIEAIEIPLANTDGIFPDREQRLAHPKWFFENLSESQLTRYLKSCDLRPEELRMLLDKSTWIVLTNGVEVSPPEQLIWSLKPQTRQQLYSALSRSAANFPQCFPFRFPLNGFDERFRRSNLPLEEIEKIKRLSYTDSGCVCFTDLASLKPVLSPGEFNDVIETLYQVPAYILRLHVTPDSDIEALVQYWGKGGREKLIAPLLNSLAKVPGGGSFNISYFLPEFARLRLYTYPYAWSDPSVSKQDCFFTSMNFFNTKPNTNFLDRAYTARVLQNEYVRVEQRPSFGDVVALSSSAGDIFHTCVYIADDFVFTKNGVDPEQPWVLMKIVDMLMLYYPTDRSGHISFLRRRDLS
jgi:hypothetical protein